MNIFTHLLASIALAASTTVFAKDCPCEQHKAGAMGKGSCTLTETSSRCSISYEGSSSTKAAARISQELTRDFRISRTPSEIMSLLDQKKPELFTPAEFREVFVTGIAVSSDSSEPLRQFSKPLNLTSEPKGDFDNQGMRELYAKFRTQGCIEAKFEGTRYLILSLYSKFDGGCK